MAEDPKYADAVSRLKDALVRVKGTKTLQKMERKKKEVLDEFQHAFTPEEIAKLSGEKLRDLFRDFLKPSSNKHWSSLARSAHRAANEERLPDLQKALAILLDEKELSVATRLDKAQIKNVSKAVLTAILQVAYPDRYGVWNTRSEEGLKRLGVWPKRERGATLGERYESINNRLLELSKSVGIDLWTLDVLWFSVRDEVAEAAKAAAEIEQDNEEGYSSDRRIREAVEQHAMKMAYECYKAKNYEVDARKCRTESYDMECTKDGTTLHVEVKGTQGSGEKIILTEREIEHAEKYPMELCVVWGIKVARRGKKTVEASGGSLKVYPDWNPRGKNHKMDCIAYRCTLPGQP